MFSEANIFLDIVTKQFSLDDRFCFIYSFIFFWHKNFLLWKFIFLLQEKNAARKNCFVTISRKNFYHRKPFWWENPMQFHLRCKDLTFRKYCPWEVCWVKYCYLVKKSKLVTQPSKGSYTFIKLTGGPDIDMKLKTTM